MYMHYHTKWMLHVRILWLSSYEASFVDHELILHFGKPTLWHHHLRHTCSISLQMTGNHMCIDSTHTISYCDPTTSLYSKFTLKFVELHTIAYVPVGQSPQSRPLDQTWSPPRCVASHYWHIYVHVLHVMSLFTTWWCQSLVYCSETECRAGVQFP